MTQQAIILAGGQGTRLRPYTTLFPKALVPVGEIPVLEVVIRQLAHHGFTQITLAVGHLAALIEAFFGDGSRFGVAITYAREAMPLGTAGPLRTITPLAENVLVMNADILSDIDYGQLFQAHCQSEAIATIATYRRTSTIDFGTLEYDATQVIRRFHEKPTLTHNVSMGVYAFSRRVCEWIPHGQAFGFDQLMQALIEAQQPVRAFPFAGYWLDIGRVDDYEKAVQDFEAMRAFLLPEPATIKPLAQGAPR